MQTFPRAPIALHSFRAREGRRSGLRAAVAALLLPALPAAQGAPPLTPERARTAFAELAAACAADAGALWGIDACAPVLLVDPTTRAVFANAPDAEGALVADGHLFAGALPKGVPLANAPVEWSGVRWAMVMSLFLGETPAERVTLLAHECFHLHQPALGLHPMAEPNDHLDTVDGRTWMQLEWNALQAALAAERGGAARTTAARDALDFRAARRARFPEAAEREDALEIREGLANYTGLRLAGRSDAEVGAYVAARRAADDGFAHSFAYVSGPLYGYLLDDAMPDWRPTVDARTDLGARLAEALGLEPAPGRAEAAALRHGGPALRAAEEQRERARLERIAAWRAALVDGPVLVLDLAAVTSGTMDTRRTHPFDEGRTVYTERVLRAHWGVLRVSGGAILEDRRAREGRVSLDGASADLTSGPGWTLELAPGWVVAPGGREGDRVLRKE